MKKKNYFLMILKGRKSKIKVLASVEVFLAASSHGGRQKGKRGKNELADLLRVLI